MIATAALTRRRIDDLVVIRMHYCALIAANTVA